MAELELHDDIPQKDFTIQSFLNNPTGDSGTQAIARKSALEAYEIKLAKLLKDNKQDKLKINYFNSGGSLFFHLEVPSESFKGLFYDIVIEFEDFDSSKSSLVNNRIRFFSNSPSFAYTYAHVFQTFGIFIESLSNKFSDKIFTEIPKVRNPDFNTFYEKTITFALIYIRNKNLLLLNNIVKEIRNVPVSKIGKDIPTLDEKMILYNIIKNSEKKEKLAKKRKDIRLSPGKKKISSFNKVNSKVNNKTNNQTNNKVNNKAKTKVK